ncbi:hypothetical protein QR680_008936 [Steinernema hermaphroditum]|uniref:BTB domain-containing protein n=1 Tax=Steinernema hermaphroditum TaxID=289476 RepID=A0AA39IKN3_9BILA|nr:hypothetical protein QR680_008936 [Steinernema hermaphroditum]
MASSRASASSNSQAPSWRVRTPRERSEQSGGHLAFTPKADRTILESLPPFVRRCAVIDGMNLLHTASRSSKADRYYELDAIVFLVAARELLLKDFDVRFFLPIKRIRSVKNKNVIQDLTHLNIFEYTYSNYDDVVILQYAASAGGFVVSRDKFRDVLPRMSYVFHMKERLCHASFLPADNCRMSLTVDVEDDSEEMEPWIEDEPTERERRDDVTALLEEATAAEPRAGMFYSQKGDFDYDSALYTRAFFTPERRRALLEAVEETLERLFYNARTRDTGLSLTSLVYLTCYYKPDELEEAFHTMQTKERQSMRRVLDAKDEIKFWFKKAVKARCVEKALQKEPTTFAEMLKLCNEELLKESKGVARGKNMTQRTYDDPLHPTMTATEKALFVASWSSDAVEMSGAAFGKHLITLRPNTADADGGFASEELKVDTLLWKVTCKKNISSNQYEIYLEVDTAPFALWSCELSLRAEVKAVCAHATNRYYTFHGVLHRKRSAFRFVVFDFNACAATLRQYLSSANNQLCVELHLSLGKIWHENLATPSDVADTPLRIGDATIFVSKTVLAMHSTFFLQLFSEELNHYCVDDVDVDDFLAFLAVIYPTALTVDNDNYERMLQLAERFGCSTVFNSFSAYLCRSERTDAEALVIADYYNLIQDVDRILAKMNAPTIRSIAVRGPLAVRVSDRLKVMMLERLARLDYDLPNCPSACPASKKRRPAGRKRDAGSGGR